MPWYKKIKRIKIKPNPKIRLIQWPKDSVPDWFDSNNPIGEVVLNDGHTGFFERCFVFLERRISLKNLFKMGLSPIKSPLAIKKRSLDR